MWGGFRRWGVIGSEDGSDSRPRGTIPSPGDSGILSDRFPSAEALGFLMPSRTAGLDCREVGLGGMFPDCVAHPIAQMRAIRVGTRRGTELSAASGLILLLSQMPRRKQNAELRNSG